MFRNPANLRVERFTLSSHSYLSTKDINSVGYRNILYHTKVDYTTNCGFVGVGALTCLVVMINFFKIVHIERVYDQ